MLVVLDKNTPETGQGIIQRNGGRIWGEAFVCLYTVCICVCMHVCVNTHLYALTYVLWIANHLHGSNIKSSFLLKETKHWKHERKTEPHESGQGGRAYLYFYTWKYKKENLPPQAKGKVALSTTNHIFPTKKRKKKKCTGKQCHTKDFFFLTGNNLYQTDTLPSIFPKHHTPAFLNSSLKKKKNPSGLNKKFTT